MVSVFGEQCRFDLTLVHPLSFILASIPLAIHAKILLDFGFSFWENTFIASEKAN